MIIHKYIVHLLDKKNDAPVLNDFAGAINQEIGMFLQKAIKKVLNTDKNKKFKFNNYNSNTVKNISEDILYNEQNFIEDSKEIASYLFDCMQEGDIESCDLIVALITIKDEKMLVVLNLEFSSYHTHLIDFVDDKFSIKVVENNNILTNRKITNGAIIPISGANDEYHLKGFGCQSFVKNFLEATSVKDDLYKTKIFNTVTDYILINYTTDVKETLDAITYRDYILKERDEIEIDKFIKDLEANIVVSTTLEQELERYEVIDKFNIDKKYIEKKLKRKVLKTDTGIEIKLNSTALNDPMKFKLKQNLDGSYDLIIKNVQKIR